MTYLWKLWTFEKPNMQSFECLMIDTVGYNKEREGGISYEGNNIMKDGGENDETEENQSKNIGNMEYKGKRKNIDEIENQQKEAKIEDEVAQNDIPSGIDFDAESLSLDKNLFKNYSEDKEQEHKMRELEGKFETMTKQHLTVMTCLHTEMHALKEENMELNLKLKKLISQTQKTSIYDKSKETKGQSLLGDSSKLVTEVEKLKETLLFYKQQNKTLANVVEKFKEQSNCDGKEMVTREDSCDSIIAHLNRANHHHLNQIVQLRQELHGALQQQPLSAFIKSTPLFETKQDSAVQRRSTVPKMSRITKSKQDKNM